MARENAGRDWVQTVVDRGFTEADVAQLRRDGILVTNETYRQVFSAYIGNALPPFVTSDSLLNAYHVLYEESVRNLEQVNARRLPKILRFVLANLDEGARRLPADPQMRAAAKRRATIVVGTALRLVDPEYQAADESVQSLIEQEIDRIVAARDRMKPAWLGPSQWDFLALDYNRYRVRGFYTRSEALARYFRAIAWLQSIPFRVAKDEELLSILMLGRCITLDRFGDDSAPCRQYRDYFSTYKTFLGTGDDWDLLTAADQVSGGAGFDLDNIRKRLLQYVRAGGDQPQINDQFRLAPDDPNITAEANFRILSGYRLPDAVLFHRTTDLRQFQFRMPTGLEVCAALGSTFARDRIEGTQKPKIIATIEQAMPLFRGSSLYADYLRAVAALLDAPDAKAPPFMKGQAWQAKSCGTALAGWAQLRHTWALQAKPNASYGARMRSPQGFVEPEPEFYRRMADLAARTRTTLDGAHAFDVDRSDASQAMLELAGLLDKSADEAAFYQQLNTLRWGERDDLKPAVAYASGLEGDTPTKIARLRQFARELQAGHMDPTFEKIQAHYDVDLRRLWQRLEQTSRRLEAMARRQLAGIALSEDDGTFLREYGETLAGLMLYGGNSYLRPRDDAPRITDVYWDSIEGSLHVGTSRPRAIYVLYPWQGKDILCKGAILPYYEFVHQGRLTDSEWRGMLDDDSRPDVPKWLRPIIGEKGLHEPDFEGGKLPGRRGPVEPRRGGFPPARE